MKGGTVQINWHDVQPVLTLDFHPLTGLLATGGNDHDIKLWVIVAGDSQKKLPTASYQTSLAYHSSSVNVLRFSPSGELLASGADGGELVVWKLHAVEDTRTWKFLKTLIFHRKDVLDLQWSADGAYLVSGSVDNSCIIWDVKKGIQKYSSASEMVNTAYIISRKDLSRPAVLLPGASKPIVAVRFCPILFCLRGSKSDGFFKLPYRVVFAVATMDSLYIYDTESLVPIAIFAGVHYSAITDISWSPNAKYLALSSNDGYCTVLEFENDELGLPYSLSESKKSTQTNAEPTNMKPEFVGNMEIGKIETPKTVTFKKKETPKTVEKPDAEAGIAKRAVSTPTQNTDTSTALKKKRITPIAIT